MSFDSSEARTVVDEAGTPTSASAATATAEHRKIEVEIRHARQLLSQAISWHLGSCRGIEVVDSPSTPGSLSRVVVADYATALALLERDEAPGGRRILIVADAVRELEVNRALHAGAFGYLILDSTLAEIEDGVRKTAAGIHYICREAAACLAARFGRAELTRRELQVIELVASGLCNKTIARQMELTLGTVKSHVRSIFSKLGTRSRTAAARVAHERGLVFVGGDALEPTRSKATRATATA